MLDPTQYLRMQNLFGMNTGMPTDMGVANPDPSFTGGSITGPGNNPWAGVNIAPPQSTSVPSGAPPVQAASTQPSGSGTNIEDMVGRLYHPETAATDRFTKMMDSYPKRSENEPSVLRRIGGALMAVGGSLPAGRGMNFYKANPQAIGQGVGFMDKPFEDKLEDWKNQIGPAEQGAQFERYRNVNERTMAYQTVANKLKQDAESDRVAKNDKDAQIKEFRARVYEFKALHPGLKFDFKGATVKTADPISGKIEDTGIPTGSLDELDKMNLAQDFSMQRIGAQGQNAEDLEGTRQKGRETLQNMKGWDVREINDPEHPGQKISVRMNMDTGDVQPVTLGGKQVSGAGKNGKTGSEKPETPTQTRVRQFNIARELYNTRPDLRPFIKIGNPGSNDFTVQPPVEGFFGHRGPSTELYNEAKQKIYGDTIPQPVSSHSPNGPAVIAASASSGPPQNGPDIGKNPPPRNNTGGTRGRDYSKEKSQVPKGRVLVVDKTSGEPAGSIPDTPEQRQLAAKKYQVVD